MESKLWEERKSKMNGPLVSPHSLSSFRPTGPADLKGRELGKLKKEPFTKPFSPSQSDSHLEKEEENLNSMG